MALTIKQLLDYSWMSQAAYLDFSSTRDFFSELTNSPNVNPDKILADAQAKAFTGSSTPDSTDGYSFISYTPNDSWSGFSSTVFKSNADNTYTIAVRGTEPSLAGWNDLILADGLGVVASGMAIGQLMDAFRYYKQITTPVGQAVQYSTAELDMLGRLQARYTLGNFLSSLVPDAIAAGVAQIGLAIANDKGLGELIPIGATINFTGHSLGGHVAYLLAEMVAVSRGTDFVGDVATYNAPGQNFLPFEIGNWLGLDTTNPTGTIGSKHIAVIGEGGLNVTAGLGQVIGTPQAVFIEDTASLISPFANHSIVKLSDSLAMYQLFKTIDSNLTDVQIKSILMAASNQGQDSLEKTLDALRKIILGGNLSPTLVTDDTGSAARNDYYANLQELTNSIAVGSLTVRDLSAFTAAQVASVAQNNIAYRYALKELNPFVVLGADYSTHNATGDLDLYDNATGLGLTANWLEDRAAMLTWAIKRNTEDSTATVMDGPEQLFRDLTTRTEIRLGSGSDADRRHFIFGSDRGETLLGGNLSDRLYGMAGNDGLQGGDGVDYLEGGQGNDTLQGGAGDDELVGGKDTDWLYGGTGNDTYRYHQGDGADILNDNTLNGGDGIGRIVYVKADGSEAQITGAGATSTGVKGQSRDSDFTYAYTAQLDANGIPQSRGILTIQRSANPQDVIVVQNFRNGELGITLQLDPVSRSTYFVETDTGTKGPNTLYQGGSKNNLIHNAEGDDQLYGEAGNDILIAAGGNDELYGGLNNDALQGGADNDYLEGNEGDDLLDGGAGADVLYGGDGNDFLFGGGSLVIERTQGQLDDPNASAWGVVMGTDGQPGLTAVSGYAVIAGDEANLLDGGVGNDFLVGGENNDFMDGGNDDDTLVGISGEDDLRGGAGNDKLFGDGTRGDIMFTGDGIQGEIINGGVSLYTLPEYHGNDYLDGGDGNDALVGDGGADELFGGSGDDILIGDNSNLAEQWHGADYLDGGDGNDTLIGYGKNDILYGGAGDDMLEGDSNTIDFALHGNDYLDGGDGNDTLQGDGGNDTLLGGSGNDQLFGDTDDTPAANQGNDYLDGGAGDDYLRGYGGNDTLIGGDGADELLAEAGDDTLDGGSGNDRMDGGADNDILDGGAGDDEVWGGAGQDTLAGGDGADILVAGDGQDTLEGDAGDDTLWGGGGNDTLIGGLGSDGMAGGEGDDIYLLNLGDGQDGISDGEGINTIEFGAGITVDSIRATYDNNTGNLILFYGVGTDYVALDQGFPGYAIQQYKFADGTTLSHAELMDIALQSLDYSGTEYAEEISGSQYSDTINGGLGDDTLLGKAGNDKLYGSAGNDTLIGGKGDDLLQGGGHGDSYMFGLGDGQDTVVESGMQGVDSLVFGDGIAAADLAYNRLANGDLRIGIGGTQDAVTVKGWFNGATPPIERIVFVDGTEIAGEALRTLPISPIEGTAGDDTLTGTNYDDTLLGLEGNDALDGGMGNDILIGGTGTDSYRLGWNSGKDTAIEAQGETSAILLDIGIDLAGVGARRTGDDLEVYLKSRSNSLILKDYFTQPQTWTVQDAEGNSISADEVLAAAENASVDAVAAIQEMWNGFKLEARNELMQQYLPYYHVVAPDVLQYQTRGVSGDYTWKSGYSITTTTAYGNTTETITSNNYYAFNLFVGSIHDDTVMIDTQRIDSDDAVLYVQDGYLGTMEAGDYVLASVQWGSPLAFSTSSIGSTSSSSVIGGAELVGSSSITSRYSSEFGRINGVVTDFTPGSDPYAVLFDHVPSQLMLYHSQNETHYALSEVFGGDGDNEIHGGTLVDGGAGNDRLYGDGNSLLYGGNGDDYLENGKVMIGGEGDDYLSGGQGATRFFYTSDNNNSDWVEDQGGSTSDYYHWYLKQQGVALAQTVIDGFTDVQESQDFGGMYWFGHSDAPFGGYFDLDTLQALIDGLGWSGFTMDEAMRYGYARYVPRLTDFPAVNAHDYAALAEYFASPDAALDTIEFGPGVSLDDLNLSWGEVNGQVVLRITWNGGNEIWTPIPRSYDQIGTGIEQFRFADGSVVGMGEMIDLAPPHPDFDAWVYAFYPDSGEQVLDIPPDALMFHSSLSPVDISMSRGGADLVVSRNGSTDSLRLVNWYADLAAPPQLTAYFGDGTTIAPEELGAMGLMNVQGSDGADVLEGFNGVSNGLYGNGGDDALAGGDGDDVLDGGAGNDILLGGTGSDTYLFGLGSGTDSIADQNASGTDINTVRIGAGVNPADIVVAMDGNQLLLTISGTTDTLSIMWDTQSGYGVQRVEFVDGTVWDAAALEGMVVPSNTAPVLANPISVKHTVENSLFTFQIPAGTFADPDVGEMLTYSSTLADGSPLPSWLVFNAATGVFSGTPGLNDAGILSLTVTATDRGGLAASGNFDLDIANLIQGSAYSDTVSGTAGNDFISMGTGNDTVNGGDGDDIIVGGTGSDVLAGGTGNDTFLIAGSDSGYDRFEGGDGIDLILGGAGDDVIRVNYFTGAYTVEKINGGAGNNVIAGTQYSDTIDLSGTEVVNVGLIDGGTGNDTLIGSAGDDVILGGVGSDVLAGGGGNDTFLVEGNDSGYDRFQGGDGIDLIQGGAGDDVIRVNYFTGAYTVERIDGGAGSNIISGTQYSDTIDLSGTELANIGFIDGGVGNDTITGSSGEDTIIGGTGSDVLAGGAGNDTFLLAGNDTGYDRFQGGEGSDLIQGSTGDDVIRVNYFTGAYTVEKIDGGAGSNVIAGTQYSDTIDLSGTELVNVGLIDGGTGNDTLIGSAGNDVILGSAGSDVLAGGAGNDTFLLAGNDTGYDRFQGGEGSDLIQGGAGDDVIRVNYFTGVYTVERIDGGAGSNIISGTQYSDTINLSSTELVNIGLIDGGVGNDTITGSAGNDIVQGMSGADALAGTSGNNLLDGGVDNDSLIGGAGNELLVGGYGNDTINSGAGYDVIAFNAGDGQDMVNASAEADNTLSLGGGISYADMAFSKSGNDLVLKTGGTDQITFKDWYAATGNHSVLNLQVIAEAMADFAPGGSDVLRDSKVETFNFAGVVDRFDQAVAADSNLTSWALTNALMDFHVGGSDVGAIGGDLAYQYGRVGTLAGIGLSVAQSVISSAQFGQSTQTLNSPATWQAETVKLG